MKISDLLTIPQTAEALGASRRAVYRAIARAREDGHEVVVQALGKSLVPKAALRTLERYYFPYYSESHQRMVKKWGAAGGRQKKLNSARAASSLSGTSSTKVAGRKSE